MKKNAFLTLFILLLFLRGNAQSVRYDHRYNQLYEGFYKISIGFKFSPALSMNSLDASGDFKGMQSVSSKLGGSIGPIADLYLNETTALSTGLLYTLKRVDYALPDTISFYKQELFHQKPLSAEEKRNINAAFNLHCLQIPLTLKVFSDGLLSDCPAYLQFGGIFNLKVKESAINKGSNPIAQYQERLPETTAVFRPYHFSVMIGFGGETCLKGSNDSFFFGMQYQKGISKINNVDSFSNLITNNGMLMLDFGFKF